MAAHFERALALHHAGQLEEAKRLYEQIAPGESAYVEALHHRGVIAWQERDAATAERLMRESLALNEANAACHSNLGIVLKGQGRFDEATASYDRAIALDAQCADAHYNRAILLKDRNELGAAIAGYDAALAARADYPGARWNKALALLLDGRLQEGWPLYEMRWEAKGLQPPGPRDGLALQRFWTGHDSVRDKTLFLYHEQGLGDTLQFCRYASIAGDMGARVVLQVQPPLVSLLRSLQGAGTVLPTGAKVPAFDFHCPLMSLPLALSTRLDSIPAPQVYLRAEVTRAREWKARLLERLGEKAAPRVGLAWSGSEATENEGRRSVALAELLRHLPQHLQYVSLQKELRGGDAATLAAHGVAHFGDELRDFGDTAALCMQLDLVVSVDTSVAHLAGALGQPVWLLLPFSPDWRWLLGRDDSPWYPSMRLLRQPAPGDWASVLARLGGALRELPARRVSALAPASSG